MKIKDLGDIIVDLNVLPPQDKKKVPAKLVKEKPNNVTPNNVTPQVLTFKKPSMHRLVIDSRCHIPYKITGYDEFEKMVNDILDENEDNFFLNEYPHHVDDVPHIYSLDFDWNLSGVVIDSILDTLAECTEDRNCPSHFIARNEESGKLHIYVRMVCECKAKIGVLTKWGDSMWEQQRKQGVDAVNKAKVDIQGQYDKALDRRSKQITVATSGRFLDALKFKDDKDPN